MAVSVTCVCGRRLTAASRFAGKRVKCPNCAQVITLPVPTTQATREPATGSVEVPETVCPQCRAAMATEDKLCIECGYHRELGEQLQTAISEPLMHGRPRNYWADEHEDRLIFTRGPALKGGLPWALAVLAIGLAVLSVVWLYSPITAAALLLPAIPIYGLALHRERISVDRRWLTVRHNPFPWPRRTIPVNDVEQLYCRQRCHSRSSRSGVYYTHEVCVLTKNGRRLRIIANLRVESHAFYFEERIEHFLGIADREVEESTWERYNWAIRFAVLLVLAIAVLIVTNFF